MKNQSITTQANITMTDVENYISTRFPEHAQPGQRYSAVIDPKKVAEFITVRERIRSIYAQEIKLDYACDEANSTKEALYDAWRQAENRMAKLEMRTALHRFFTRCEVAEAIQAHDEAKAKFEAAKAAADKAFKAHTEAYSKLVAERDLKVAEAQTQLNMLRKPIANAIADAMTAPVTVSSNDSDIDSDIATIHGIVRDVFVGREMLKEAVISLVLQHFAAGEKEVLISKEVFVKIMKTSDGDRDLHAHHFTSHAAVACFVAEEVAKRIGLSFIRINHKMAENSEYEGPAYITVK